MIYFGRTGSSKTARKRDNRKLSLSSAPSIEETGLDFLLYGEGLPFLAPPERLRKTTSTPAETFGKALSSHTSEAYFDSLPKPKNAEQEDARKGGSSKRSITAFSDQFSIHGTEGRGNHISSHGGGQEVGRKRMDPKDSMDSRDSRKLLSVLDEAKKTPSELLKDNKTAMSILGKGILRAHKESLAKHESLVPHREGSKSGKGSNNRFLAVDTCLSGIDEEDSGEGLELDDKPQETENVGGEEGSHGDIPTASPVQAEIDLVKATRSDKEAGACITKLATIRVARDRSESLHSPSAESDPVDTGMVQSPSGRQEARNRWRRVKHTLAFAHQMSQTLKSNSGDFLEHAGLQENNSNENGRAGAAAFEGAKIKGRFRAKGRQGMEGMLVRQDKGIMTLVQDFYVACLKMPVAHFLVGVFLAPIALGLFFTPFYLLDRGGLTFDGVNLAEVSIIVGRVAAAKKRVSALVNVFLYALSLSTTFGGSPVAALSPFCLCIANVNTLMGQFLFVFLSGAVFARMSQPSKPIRCSRKAIIRLDDFTSTPSGDEPNEKSKVFAVRLVLTGASPCELVDAKICLTFRIFIKLPSGSMFCSTQDLDLVRPEVSYLKYGIMVRHVIDSKSPVHGHTMESLLDGDASFSLTIMGLERTSMQPIFHLEDYFVCDGDVAWDAEYVDFIHINNEGHRVLDHSKIDQIKITADTKIATGSSLEGKKIEGGNAIGDNQGVLKGWRARGVDKSKALHAKSTSFTRADW